MAKEDVLASFEHNPASESDAMTVPSIQLELTDRAVVLRLWRDLIQYRIQSLDALQGMWHEVAKSFAPSQFFGLGLAVAMLAAATADPAEPMLDRVRLSKYLDSYYLIGPDPQTSRDFQRGLREGMDRLSKLQTAPDLSRSWRDLVIDVNREVSGGEAA